ncbi:hypothetical protein K458DRAFT_482924 [Lentithecium fluviatile CBS 122367]|uniref:Uncharacterized protein n=1 Tax=Lentithecium fluviatile CBS 122367 TaxID=1168545 RepID=A0A6G1JKG7_9PLEO|nr:hypothetical protein K458DRAFT_482924 [Lentithecium fluviatile CBS 122367]
MCSWEEPGEQHGQIGAATNARYLQNGSEGGAGSAFQVNIRGPRNTRSTSPSMPATIKMLSIPLDVSLSDEASRCFTGRESAEPSPEVSTNDGELRRVLGAEKITRQGWAETAKSPQESWEDGQAYDLHSHDSDINVSLAVLPVRTSTAQSTTIFICEQPPLGYIEQCSYFFLCSFKNHNP